MNSKSLIIIGTTTLALVGLAAIVASNRSAISSSTTPAAPKPLFDGLTAKLSTVSRILIKRADQEAILVRDASGKNWSLENKGGYPASFDSIRPIVAAVANATIVDLKTSKPELFDKLDLQDPTQPNAKGTLITLQDDSGVSLASLIVGKTDAGPAAADPFSQPPADAAPKRFARRSNENQTYLITADLEVDVNPLTYMDRSAINIPNNKIKSLTIVSPEIPGISPAETLRIDRPDAAETKFTVQSLPAGRALKEESAPSRVAQSLSFVNFDDVRPAAGPANSTSSDAASQVPAAAFNWADPTATRGTYELFDGTRIGYTVLTVDGVSWVRFSSSFEPTPAPAKAPSSSPTAQPPVATPPAANATADVTQLPTPPAPATPAAPATPEASTGEEAAHAHHLIQATLKTESDTQHNKWSKWAYALPEFKVSQFRTRMADLLAPAPADAASEGGAAPAITPFLPPPGPLAPQ